MFRFDSPWDGKKSDIKICNIPFANDCLYFFGARFFFSRKPCSPRLFHVHSLSLSVLPIRSTYACRFVLISWYFSIVRHNFICKRNQTLFNELCLHTSIHPFGNTAQSLWCFYPWQNRFFFHSSSNCHPSIHFHLFILFICHIWTRS